MIGEQVTGHTGLTVKLLREIGAGGFGTVYLGEDAQKKQYAVKVIGPITDEDAALSFEKELNAASGLSHENLLLPIDHGECQEKGQKCVFIINAYCQDGSYRKRLQSYGQNPSIDSVLADFDQILVGLSTLHTKLLHRDLKPENILVSGQTLKIGDFGLSKFVDDATQSLTFKGSGTPVYMAPEMWERKNIAVPADLYAVGVMLFEALIGRPPFQAKDTHDLQKLHLYEAAPRVQKLRPDVPVWLDGVVKRLLDKDAQRRFQSAEEVRKALKASAGANHAVTPAIAAMRQHHDAEEQKRLAAAQAQQTLNDSAERNKYMQKQLLEMFDDVVSSMNTAVPDAPIRIEGVRGGDMTYSFGERRLQIGFFSTFPTEDRQYPAYAEELRQKNVVHAGYIIIDQHGEMLVGWNLVLIRTPESGYGDWQFVAVSCSPFTARSFRNGTAPLPADELTKAYYNHRRNAMDIYNTKEHPLTRDDVQRVVDHLIPTLVKLETRAEQERAQRAFEEDLHRY